MFVKFNAIYEIPLSLMSFLCLDPYLDHWCIVGETNYYDVPKPGTLSPLEIEKTRTSPFHILKK